MNYCLLWSACSRHRWCEEHLLISSKVVAAACRVLLSRKVQVWDGFKSTIYERSLYWLLHWGIRRSDGCADRVGAALSSQSRATNDQLPQLIQGDSPLRVDLEDPLQNTIELVRYGKNGLEKIPVTDVGAEGRVVHRCSLPRIAPTSQVDQDHSKGPDIVGCRCIGCIRLGIRLLTLYKLLV